MGGHLVAVLIAVLTQRAQYAGERKEREALSDQELDDSELDDAQLL